VPMASKKQSSVSWSLHPYLEFFRCFSDECVSWAIAGAKELESLGLVVALAEVGSSYGSSL
jgi:hypothetical protein